MERVTDFVFLGSRITVDGDWSHKIKRRLLLGRKAVMNLDSILKKQRHHFADKGLYSQSYGFSSSHVQMWELDQKEGWAPKYWCFWTVVLEKTLESLLGCKEIQPVHPKGDQSWVLIGRNDYEAETPKLWPPDAKSWLIEKDPDAGKDWRQEEKGTTEDEMGGWHHWLNGHEFEQAPGAGEGQGGLVWCGPWGGRVGQDWATGLNWRAPCPAGAAVPFLFPRSVTSKLPPAEPWKLVKRYTDIFKIFVFCLKPIFLRMCLHLY